MADALATAERLRVLIVAPSLDGNDISEPEWAFHWTEELTKRADVTVLSSSRKGTVPLAEQLPSARVVTWPEIPFLYTRLERINAMAKPGLPLFSAQVRRWIRKALSQGERFDIAHQMLPQAMRHATPLRDLGIPYVIGPLGGGLKTPSAFASEVLKGESFSIRLRKIDDFRLRHDPALRSSYSNAELVLGVAPYVKNRLKHISMKSFHALPERGHGDFAPVKERQTELGRLRLFHAGRTIRTKGLRDVIRALAHLSDLPEVTLVSAGDGEDMAACRKEAERLDLADKITFLGRVSRERVESEYSAADAFCFPSFREPMGGVLFEAMAHGLPIITAARGGPDFLVDDSCGIRVPVDTPEQFAREIAQAIRHLALNPDIRSQLGTGARARLRSFGSWDDKAELMMRFYRKILADRSGSEVA